MKRVSILDVLNMSDIPCDITVCGWVRTRRDSKGGFSFIELNDGSCFENLQLIVPADLENYQSEVLKLTTGASICVKGQLIASNGKGQRVELQSKHLTVLGFCDVNEYPLQKQQMSFEYLREVAHLRTRTNTFGAVMRMRNLISQTIHHYFSEQGFFWSHTPILTASDCEGAGAMFQVTTLDLDKLPLEEKSQKVNYDADFFGKRTHLTVSGQLEGETQACALGKIYTFGPTFRAENSNTRRHLSEFWMVEPEIAFADLNDDAELAEGLLKACFKAVLEKGAGDLNFFNQRIDTTLRERLSQLVEAQFTRISYTQAVEELQKSGEKFDYPIHWGADLQTEHERYLTEVLYKGPVVVMHYPKEIKSFYMKLNEDGKTVAAMDVLLPHVGEIIGGSQREENLEKLNARMIECGLEPETYTWYCDLRRYGTVPHAGFGLGLERLVQFCTGMHNIRDVIAFPRAPKSCDF